MTQGEEPLALGGLTSDGPCENLKKLRILKILLIAAAIGLSDPVTATADIIGSFGAWNAFHDGLGDDEVCYVASLPKLTAQTNLWHREAFVLIAHRPRSNEQNVFEFQSSYHFKDESEVELIIDGKKLFTLFTKDKAAWSRDSATDLAISEALKQGREMKLIGVSVGGRKMTDTYLLFGIKAALALIKEECFPPTSIAFYKAENKVISGQKKSDKADWGIGL